MVPWKGAPLRVVFVAEKPLEGELSLIAPDGSVAAKSRERHGGPPYFWFAEVKSPAAGKWRASARTRPRAGRVQHDHARNRGARRCAAAARHGGGERLAAARHMDRATENLFSAWIEKLFDDPLDAAPSWPALHVVLRDRSRNLLFNHLGLGEDAMKMVLRPDCADLPYFLRAYFAFKMGLPFGFSKCTRGGGGRPPHCPQWFSIQNAEDARPPPPPTALTAAPGNRAERILGTGRACRRRSRPRPRPRRSDWGSWGPRGRLRISCRSVADSVHSGSGRTAAADNNTDYYPVPLSQETLRPGTVYADPYGHILMIVRRVPQSDGRGGRHSRGRRAARRHGRAQALLARQFPVRPGSRARRPRVQALPAGRARQERRPAAAEQRRNRQRTRTTPISRSTSRDWRSKNSTIEWTT